MEDEAKDKLIVENRINEKEEGVCCEPSEAKCNFWLAYIILL
jgi:hypothetical protein